MPKRSASGPLMRDLHLMTGEIDAKAAAATEGISFVTGLRSKVDTISDDIGKEEKEREERVGLVEKLIAAHEFEKVQEALKHHNKTMIDAFEFKELRALESGVESERAKKKQKLNTEVEIKVKDELRFMEHDFAERFATAEAKEKSFQAERRTLTETIEALRVEIESQKRLTGDIAKAAAQPPPIQVMRNN